MRSKTNIRSIYWLVLTAALCACLALALSVPSVSARADEEEKTVQSVSYAEHQIISYGKLLADELDTRATITYSDGSEEEAEIEFTEIPAQTGVNVNFTTVNIAGVVKGTDIAVTCAVTTMPDDLVYFINAGSSLQDNKWGDGIDPNYGYNQTVFAYYGDTLLNSGTPDQTASKGGDTWGCYTNPTHSAPGDGTFPYNTLLWNDEGANTDMGYMLTNLTAGASYRIFMGTLSHWHPRTVKITFNGNVVGQDTLRILASKAFTVYENVPADSNGKIDLYMQGASTNEPCITFIAVQSMDTPYAVTAPGKLTAASTIGMEDHTVTFTSGIQTGTKVQLYNAARPYNLLYEEAVDESKIQNGSYTVDFGTPFTGVSQFYAVQIHDGGASDVCGVSITDIMEFSAELSPDTHTSGSVTVTVRAHAQSGIASWSYRNGEYGEIVQHDLDLPYALNGQFTVTENGNYVVVVTSGLGVTYSETVSVTSIDPDRPVINVTPSEKGWGRGSYNVGVSVTSIAPVVSFALYKDGQQLIGAATVPSMISLAEEGEYVMSVANAAGVSAVRTVTVSSRATTAVITKRYASRTLTYTFSDSADYAVASVAAHEVTARGVNRMTISSGNRLDVYNPGTYVITVTTKNGAVEMFAVVVDRSDFSAETPGLSRGTTLGVGLGIGLGGAVLAAAAVVTVWFLIGKKKKTA